MCLFSFHNFFPSQSQELNHVPLLLWVRCVQVMGLDELWDQPIYYISLLSRAFLTFFFCLILFFASFKMYVTIKATGTDNRILNRTVWLTFFAALSGILLSITDLVREIIIH